MEEHSDKDLSSTKKRKLPSVADVAVASDNLGPVLKTYSDLVTEKARLTQQVDLVASQLQESQTALDKTLSNEAMLNQFLEEEVNNDNDWAAMYMKLREYKDKYGDCLVPRNNKKSEKKNIDSDTNKLGMWVYKQRQAYRGGNKIRYKQDSTDGEEAKDDNASAMKLGVCEIEPYKITLLERIGFDWDPIRTRWEGKLKGIVKWMKEHDGGLPNRKDDIVLGGWLKKVGENYNMYEKGKPASELNPQRIELLQQAGLIVNGRMRKPSDKLNSELNETHKPGGRYELWNDKLKELMKFQTFHGHFEVPLGHRLQAWVKQQRKTYDELQKKNKVWKSDKMKIQASQKIGKLREVGFPFDSEQVHPSWYQMFNRLQGYHALFGNCNVRIEFDLTARSKGLGRWVSEQRKDYLLFEQGRSKVLDKKKVDLLESIRFEWAAQI